MANLSNTSQAGVAPRLVSIGECMVELQDLLPLAAATGASVAGDTLNTAIHASRAGLAVSYATAVGADPVSDAICAFMQAEGVTTDLIARLPGRLPGLYAISLTDAGERSFSYWRSASAARDMLGPGGIDLDRLAAFDAVYLSGITLAILPPDARARLLARMADWKDAGITVAIDTNYRPALWASVAEAQDAARAALSACTIALPSLEDAEALFGTDTPAEVIALLKDLGVAEGAVKCGADGPVALENGTTIAGDYPIAETVIDTTGAGDAFNGAYLAARLAGASVSAACSAGHGLAASVIGQKGAVPPRV